MHPSRGFIRVRGRSDHPGRVRRPAVIAVGGAAAVLVIAICASCSAASDGTPTAIATTSAQPASSGGRVSTSPSPTAHPTTPLDLQGSWEATISTGEDVTLTLSPYGFTVRRGSATGTGNIEVDGDLIVFTSPLCDLGPGAYEWSIQDGALVFTPLEPRDPCPNRIIFLEDAIYTRTD